MMGYDMTKTSLYIPKEKYQEIKDYCQSHGMTVNGLIKVLLDRYMQTVNTEDARNA